MSIDERDMPGVDDANVPAGDSAAPAAPVVDEAAVVDQVDEIDADVEVASQADAEVTGLATAAEEIDVVDGMEELPLLVLPDPVADQVDLDQADEAMDLPVLVLPDNIVELEELENSDQPTVVEDVTQVDADDEQNPEDQLTALSYVEEVPPPSEDLESTVVRRQSLLDPQRMRGESPVVGAPPPPPVPASIVPDWELPKTPEPKLAGRTDEVILAGATVQPAMPSRWPARLWSLLLSLLGLPVAWYLITDAGARFTLAAGNPWETGNLNPAAVGEFIGGALVLVLCLIIARWSTLGSVMMGTVTLLAGSVFVAAPGFTREHLTGFLEALARMNSFGANLAHHIVADGATGRFCFYGLCLILIGVVARSARKQGQREQALRQQINTKP